MDSKSLKSVQIIRWLENANKHHLMATTEKLNIRLAYAENWVGAGWCAAVT